MRHNPYGEYGDNKKSHLQSEYTAMMLFCFATAAAVVVAVAFVLK